MNDVQKRSLSNNEAGEISIKELIIKLQNWWRYLHAKWWVILTIGILGGIAGLTYAIIKPLHYTATLTFVLEESRGTSLGNLGGLASIAGINLGENENGLFSSDNIIELYKSRRMISKTLLSKSDDNDSLLIDRYIAFTDLHDQWAGDSKLEHIKYAIPKEQFTLQHDSIIGEIVNDFKEKKLSVEKSDKELSFLAVETTSVNEVFAKDFTEILVQNVNAFYVETKTKKALENVTLLQHQTDSVRKELNEAIRSVASAMDANPNANPARQILQVPSTRRQVDVQANQAILSELVKNLELAKISLRKDAPLIQVVDYPILPLPNDQVGMVKGIVVGGLIAGFLAVMGLTIGKFFERIMNK